ncbi:lipoate--protein ligase family protein, partial [Candidatus Bathyarchaeota archaeon]|nr:lipoate--protein ligase family protein [Candidatus Bathyarchaeota archaeon]
ISGGGAVYHDTEDEITYSVVMRRERNEAADVVKAYNHICYGLIEASRKLGVNAEYHRRGSRQCPNITVGGRKISGSAQANRKGVILQHGTFLLRIDVDKMFSFLGTPSEKGRAKVVAIARRRLTSIVDELGDEVSKKRICEILVKGFEKALDVDVVEGSLTNHELDVAKKLEKEKFATRKWNLEGKT